MKLHKENGLRPELEAMDTHELNLLLQQEAAKPPAQIDEELARQIWMALEQREAEPMPDDPAVQAAQDKYRAGCKTVPRRKPNRWVLRTCVAAAALCLLLTAIPRASGENLLVEFFKRVREDVVAFFRRDEEDNRLQPDYEMQHSGLEELRKTVEEYGVTVPVVPSWIPEEYELIELKTEQFPSKNRVISHYSAENKTIILAYEIYGVSTTTEFIKDAFEYNSFEFDGIKHYIYTNNEKQYALWERDNVQCSIVADCREETLREILASIYNMEDQ